MVAKKKGAGGKLSRSEVVTVRLDQKLRFAAEIVARKQRRTLSSFIEWAIEQAVSKEIVQINDHDIQEATALEVTAKIWDVDEADRFIKFAETCPTLLNFKEERLWKTIKETPYFFQHVEKEDDSPNSKLIWDTCSSNIRFERVREYWDKLQKIAEGEECKDSLPTLPENEIRQKANTADEIPF